MEGQVAIKPKSITIVQFPKTEATIVFKKDVGQCQLSSKLSGKVEVEHDRT